MGDEKKKGGRDKVVWDRHLAPCREGEVGGEGRNLANSFPAGFCTPERIVFPNSSIQKGGIIFKFT